MSEEGKGKEGQKYGLNIKENAKALLFLSTLNTVYKNSLGGHRLEVFLQPNLRKANSILSKSFQPTKGLFGCMNRERNT